MQFGVKLGVKFISALMPIVFATALSGCGQNNSWKPNVLVSPQTISGPVIKMVDKISHQFGDSHPRIQSAMTDNEESTQRPMYDLDIVGDFHVKDYKFHEIKANILADGSLGILVQPIMAQSIFH